MEQRVEELQEETPHRNGPLQDNIQRAKTEQREVHQIRIDTATIQTPRSIIERVDGDIRNAKHRFLRTKVNRYPLLLHLLRPTIWSIQWYKYHQYHRTLPPVNQN